MDPKLVQDQLSVSAAHSGDGVGLLRCTAEQAAWKPSLALAHAEEQQTQRSLLLLACERSRVAVSWLRRLQNGRRSLYIHNSDPETGTLKAENSILDADFMSDYIDRQK